MPSAVRDSFCVALGLTLESRSPCQTIRGRREGLTGSDGSPPEGDQDAKRGGHDLGRHAKIAFVFLIRDADPPRIV
jgi:hypothetical protein